MEKLQLNGNDTGEPGSSSEIKRKRWKLRWRKRWRTNENGTKQTRETEKKNPNESVRIEAETKRDGAYFICMNSYTICEWNINDVRFFGIDALIHYNSFDMKIGRSVGLLVWWFCIIYTFGLYGFSFCQMWGCCYHWRCFRRLISIKANWEPNQWKGPTQLWPSLTVRLFCSLLCLLALIRPVSFSLSIPIVEVHVFVCDKFLRYCCCRVKLNFSQAFVVTTALVSH